jgi:hypothetical protein
MYYGLLASYRTHSYGAARSCPLHGQRLWSRTAGILYAADDLELVFYILVASSIDQRPVSVSDDQSRSKTSKQSG